MENLTTYLFVTKYRCDSDKLSNYYKFKINNSIHSQTTNFIIKCNFIKHNIYIALME